MALAELVQSFVVEPTVVIPGPSGDWPDDIPPYTAVPYYLAGFLNAWYGVEFRDLFDRCFISTPSLT